MPSTTPHNLPYPASSGPVKMGAADIQALAEALKTRLTPQTAGIRSSRPPSTLGSPGIAGRTYRSTDDGGVDQDHGTGWFTLRPGLFSAPPGSPDEGMLIHFQTASMKAAGVGPWELRYDSALGTYRWAVISGGVWLATVDASQITSSSVYTDLATPGPSITVPRPGTYVVEFGATIGGTATAGTSITGLMALAVGSFPATGANAQCEISSASGSIDGSSSVAIKRPLTASADDLITAKYRQASGSAASFFAWRWLSITPVRLG